MIDLNKLKISISNIILNDPDTTVWYYTSEDNSFYKLTHLDSGDFCYTLEQIYKYIHPSEIESFKDVFQSVLSEKSNSESLICRIMNKALDTYKYYKIIFTKTIDINNSPFVVVVQIATSHSYSIKQPVKHISKEKVKLLEASTLNGYWQYDLRTKEYYWSHEIYNILGIEYNNSPLRQLFLHFIHPEDVDNYIEVVSNNLENHTSFKIHFRIISNDGIVKHIEEHVHILKDKDGNPISQYGILSDITALIKLQNEKEEAQSFINSILKALPNLIFAKDIEAGFRFTLVNNKFASFYGLSPDEIIGKYDKDISTPQQTAICHETDLKAVQHDITSPLVSVEKIPVANKAIKYMQTIKFAHVIDGINYLICSAMDITDLIKAKQRAEESDKLKSAFLANINHEIRTPMNSIIGFSELLSNADSEDCIKEYCKIIQDNSALLLNLMTDIIYLSELESGVGELTCNNIELESLFASIQKKYSQKAKSRNIAFVYIPKKMPCEVCMNREGVIELMKCFIENALKFTKEGSISIGYESANNGVRFWVKDTGVGIDSKVKKKIFKRFVKLDTFSQGTGIGLYICQKIAKAMKGKIGLDSTVGKGTTVWAWLPSEYKTMSPDTLT